MRYFAFCSPKSRPGISNELCSLRELCKRSLGRAEPNRGGRQEGRSHRVSFLPRESPGLRGEGYLPQRCGISAGCRAELRPWPAGQTPGRGANQDPPVSAVFALGRAALGAWHGSVGGTKEAPAMCTRYQTKLNQETSPLPISFEIHCFPFRPRDSLAASRGAQRRCDVLSAAPPLGTGWPWSTSGSSFPT